MTDHLISIIYYFVCTEATFHTTNSTKKKYSEKDQLSVISSSGKLGLEITLALFPIVSKIACVELIVSHLYLNQEQFFSDEQAYYITYSGQMC